jgi:hypothetical protein
VTEAIGTARVDVAARLVDEASARDDFVISVATTEGSITEIETGRIASGAADA